MRGNAINQDEDITIHDLYPELSPEERHYVEEKLNEYLKLTIRLYERIRSDPDAYARFQSLTASLNRSKMG